MVDFHSVTFPAVADDMGCGPRMLGPDRVELFFMNGNCLFNSQSLVYFVRKIRPQWKHAVTRSLSLNSTAATL